MNNTGHTLILMRRIMLAAALILAGLVPASLAMTSSAADAALPVRAAFYYHLARLALLAKRLQVLQYRELSLRSRPVFSSVYS